MSHDVAMLEALLKKARAEAAEREKETPHSRLLADLADHRVNPGKIGEALSLVFAGFALLGVDLLAEGGPARVYSEAMAKPAPAPVTDQTSAPAVVTDQTSAPAVVANTEGA